MSSPAHGDGSPYAAPQPRTRFAGPAEDEAPIDDEEFYSIVGRVDRIEQSIAPIAQKLDIVSQGVNHTCA